MRSRSPRILMTGSSLIFSARLVHDLGRRGAWVTAADSKRFSAGKASRFVSHRLLLPPMPRDPGRYLDALISELRRQPYDMLLPTFEESLLLAEYQHELRPYTRLFLPAFSDIDRLHHKPSLHRLCLTLGVPSPNTVIVHDPELLDHQTANMAFPVVVKLPDGNNSAGRTFCEDRSQLKTSFARVAAERTSRGQSVPFVQQKIDGDLVCTLCFCDSGRKLAEVVYQSLRTLPDTGGTSVHRRSIVHTEIARITDRLIAHCNWSGFLGFDFLIDRTTGIPYLIDANVRANPAIHLGYCSGLDWTQLIFDLCADKRPNPQVATAGINVHTALFDIIWMLEGLLPHTKGDRGFLRRVREFVSPDWAVHSRGDLLATGEFASSTVLGMQSIWSGLQSLVVGRTPGELMLDHACYDTSAMAKLRQERSNATRERRAA